MSHWRASGRIGSGAQANTSAYRANTPRELPSGSILSVPPLERGDITQAAIDVLALGSVALLIGSFATVGGLLGYFVFHLFFGH